MGAEPPDADAGDAETAIVSSRRTSLIVSMLAAGTVMLLPPVVAALVSGLALAVVVGMVSIITGLVGTALIIYQHEKWQRREQPAPLPVARLLPKP